MPEREVPAPLAPPDVAELSKVIGNFQNAREIHEIKGQQAVAQRVTDLSPLEQPKQKKPERLGDE